jgi:succinoglycan biosynthesis transport protein ExoP
MSVRDILDSGGPVELREYLVILRRRWMSVLIVALTILAVASLVTLLVPKKYTATTRLYFSVQANSVTELVQGSTFAEGQMSSYAQVATSPKVLDAVIREVPLSTTAEELAKSVVVTVPLNTVVLEIAATDQDPSRAARIANAVGVALANVAEELAPDRADGSESVRVTTVAPAQIPDEASSPHVFRNLALGLALGLFIGFGLAVLRHVLDTKVRSEEDVRRLTEIPILGAVPVDLEVPRHPVILRSEPHSAASESVRRLRTNLQFVDVVNRAKSVVISSSIGEEGKSTIAINLAVAFADTGARVILVDADLRRPSIAQYIGIESNVGLTTVLIGRVDVQDVVQPFGASTLDVLPTGQIPPNPSELLGSPAMAGLLDRLTATYDMVLLDSPPLLPVTDAAVLSKLAGGVLLVVGADRIHRPQLQETLVSLETAGADLFGIVLNKSDRRDQATYTYGGSYASRPDDGSTAVVQMITNWDWDRGLASTPRSASDSSAVATKDVPAASSKQNGAVPANDDAVVPRKQDATDLTRQNVDPLTKQEAAPVKQNGTGRVQQNVTARVAKQREVAAAQQNVTTLANQDEVASANLGEPAPAKQDESAPTKQENAALEQDQAEPAAWPSAPWLAEPVASQSQPAPHG